MPNTPRTPAKTNSKNSSEEYVAYEDKNRYKKKFRDIPDDDIVQVTKKLSFDEPQLEQHTQST